MNRDSKIIPIFLTVATALFLALFLAAGTAEARGKGWSWGIAGNFGVGSHADLDFTDSNDPDNWEAFQTGGGVLNVGYGLSERVGLRLNAGIDRIFNDRGYRGMLGNHWTAMVELAALFNFVKEPGTAFDPYLVTGVGFVNFVHLGAGNEFKISEKASVFAEILASSIILYHKADMRVGMKWRF